MRVEYERSFRCVLGTLAAAFWPRHIEHSIQGTVRRISLAASFVFLASLLSGCDEVPTAPDVPDRLRVVLVTSHAPETGRWHIYEIDQEGTVTPIVTSTEPIADAQYTSFIATRGSIAYRNGDDDLVVRHLESGSESIIAGPFTRPRFSPDGTMIAYTDVAVDSAGGTSEQVFVLVRSTNERIQITRNECADAAATFPCARDARWPVFGEDNEIYIARDFITESGGEQLAVSVVTISLIEQTFFILTGGERDVVPNSYFEGTLVAHYVDHEGTAEESRGFYAIRSRTNQYIENEVQMRDATFCHDATVVGWNGTELRFVDVPGDDVARLTLPSEYGSSVLQTTCSVQSRDIVR